MRSEREVACVTGRGAALVLRPLLPHASSNRPDEVVGASLTPTIFWPLINDLRAVARGRAVVGQAEVVALVRHRFAWDWLRTLLIAIGFASTIRAIGRGTRHGL